MGYRLNRLDEPVFIAVSKPLLTEFGIHHRLESFVNRMREQISTAVKKCSNYVFMLTLILKTKMQFAFLTYPAHFQNVSFAAGS